MELHVITEKKDEMEFELKGEDTTFAGLLVNQLLKNKDVEIAQYNIEHPLVGEPVFYIKTSGTKPRTAVLKAVRDIKSSLKKFKK